MAMLGKLAAETRAAIGRELRLLYADIIAEGVPERVAEILRRLRLSPATRAHEMSRHRLNQAQQD